MDACPWPIDLEACCKQVGVNPDDPRAVAVIAQVSEMMTRWSGFAFGGCATVRPLDPCGECRGGSCCSGDCIVLHDASGVTEVRVAGEVVAPADYRFDPARGTLCAVPPMTWPVRDPRYAEPGELEVDVLRGDAPSAWAMAVANELACELLLSCTGGKCRLPRNATSVSSQGVTITIPEDELKYAIPAVTAWVASVNPAGATAPARIFSPETDRARVTGSARGGFRGWR